MKNYLYRLRNRHYQSVSQVEIEESKCSIDENTSCMEDKTSIDESKSSLIEHIDNVNIKQIDEILPLMNETAFNLKNIVEPVVSYSNLLLKLLEDFRIFSSRIHIQMILVQMWIYLIVNSIAKFCHKLRVFQWIEKSILNNICFKMSNHRNSKMHLNYLLFISICCLKHDTFINYL